MRYRCPYCKRMFEKQPPPVCPGCGKMMRIARRDQTDKRRLKRRALNSIVREYEQKKAELQGPIPTLLFRNPKFYLGAVVVLLVVGGALLTATDRATVRLQITPHMRAMRNVDVLAEALGRYRFHVGSYPLVEQGLAALVRDPQVPKWDGPYIHFLRNDPWDKPFVYDPATTNGIPILFSCGADGLSGTADDVYPDPARFEPGTEWTNGWVSADQRLPGVTVLPHQSNSIR